MRNRESAALVARAESETGLANRLVAIIATSLNMCRRHSISIVLLVSIPCIESKRYTFVV